MAYEQRNELTMHWWIQQNQKHIEANRVSTVFPESTRSSVDLCVANDRDKTT